MHAKRNPESPYSPTRHPQSTKYWIKPGVFSGNQFVDVMLPAGRDEKTHVLLWRKIGYVARAIDKKWYAYVAGNISKPFASRAAGVKYLLDEFRTTEENPMRRNPADKSTGGKVLHGEYTWALPLGWQLSAFKVRKPADARYPWTWVVYDKAGKAVHSGTTATLHTIRSVQLPEARHMPQMAADGTLRLPKSNPRTAVRNPVTAEIKAWDPAFFGAADGKVFGDRRFAYVPFYQLSSTEQRHARSRYPNKSVGAMYNFADEHYLYPVKKTGELAGAQRVLAIPLARIKDEQYMKSIGYAKMNAGWPKVNPRAAATARNTVKADMGYAMDGLGRYIQTKNGRATGKVYGEGPSGLKAAQRANKLKPSRKNPAKNGEYSDMNPKISISVDGKWLGVTNWYATAKAAKAAYEKKHPGAVVKCSIDSSSKRGSGGAVRKNPAAKRGRPAGHAPDCPCCVCAHRNK